ncbi:MAG: extracellular solute-binding protein [Christensenellaceae bacterium]|jgi:putative aldouronate transport system substrate-binding protein|nr:extracellular solute-binding protein [Christensenellaceae bacterium]
MKRVLALLLVVAMAVLALAGCVQPSASPETSAPAVSDGADAENTPAEGGDQSAERTPATITFLHSGSARTTIDLWHDTAVGKALAAITNVDLSIEFLVGSDVRQKASLLIASDQYPDLINTGDASGDYYAAGAFVPLDDYLAKYENLGRAYDEVARKLMTQADGHIYWLGAQPSENAVYPSAGYYLNMDLLKQNDYPVVTDFEQWQQMIIDYVAANPTFNDQPTIGITEPSEAWRASALQYGGSRFLMGYQNDGLTVIDPETLEAKVIMDSEFQKLFVKMLNRMYLAGVADPEMFMQTNDQLLAKIGSGRVVGTYDQRGMIQNGLDALTATAPERMLVAFPVVLPGVTTERYRGPRNFGGGSGLGITTSAKNPDRVAQFLDDIASEEAQIIIHWGIEGEDWAYDADGKLSKSDEQWASFRNAEFKQERGIEQFDTYFYILPLLSPLPTSGSILSPTNNEAYVVRAYSDVENEFLSHYADKGYTTFVSWFNPSYDSTYEPGWSIRQRIATDDPRKLAGETALTTTLDYLPKLVQAKDDDAFEAIWTEFTTNLGALPLREYEALVTEMVKASASIYASR